MRAMSGSEGLVLVETSRRWLPRVAAPVAAGGCILRRWRGTNDPDGSPVRAFEEEQEEAHPFDTILPQGHA